MEHSPILLTPDSPGSQDSITRPYKLNLDLEDTRKYHAYLRITSSEVDEPDSYYDATEEAKSYDATPDSGVHDLSSIDPDQRAKYEEDWRTELARTEEEIVTLRQVLSAKLRHSQELKRKLGITTWKELKDDVEQGIKNIQESTAFPGFFNSSAYQKTSQTLKTAGEKTTSVIGTFSASVTKKLGEVKNSNAFKSFEERVGSAYSNVKTRMSNSRSASAYSFEEALNMAEGRSSGVASAATTPIIPEGKPLS